MAVIDRYLDAMQKQRAEALTLSIGSPVEMTAGGQTRAVSSNPTTAEQVHGILSEIFPDYLSLLKDGRAEFPHESGFGTFQLIVTKSGDGPSLTIKSAPRTAPTQPSPTPPIAPRPQQPQQAAPRSGGSLPSHPDELFHQILDMKASDLHLKSGKAPMIRIDGSMAHMDGRHAIDGELLAALLEQIMPEKNREEFNETNDTDFAYELGERSRMRANVFR